MTADVLAPLVAKIPDARLEVIAGAGHGLPRTHTDAWLRLLRAQFARNDAATLKAAA